MAVKEKSSKPPARLLRANRQLKKTPIKKIIVTVRAQRINLAAEANSAAATAHAVGARVALSRPEQWRAPFSLRCGALLIDYTVLIAILAFATLMARLLGGDTRWAGATVLTLGYIIAAAAALLNFVVLAGLSGRTLGKWVTDLRIERRHGGRLSFARASLRHLVGYPLTLVTFGIGFLGAAFNREGRALHDLVAGTVVVRGRRRSSGGGRDGGDAPGRLR